MSTPNQITFFGDRDGHRWTMRAVNGQVIAASTESYAEKRGAVENVAQLFAADIHAGHHVIPDTPDRIAVVEAIADRYEVTDLTDMAWAEVRDAVIDQEEP